MQTTLPPQIETPRKGIIDIEVERIARYVKDRQNQDGGYTFAQWTESSAQDTYFALSILEMLNITPDHRDETARFLQGLQSPDGSFDSISVAYYCVSSLSSLGAKPQHSVRSFASSLRRSHGGFGNLDVDMETSSEFQTTYLVLSILKLSDEVDSGLVVRFILGRMNPDGTFGSGSGYSSLASVHFATASLALLGYKVDSLDRTARWLRHCELPRGGFTSDPRDTSYLVLEDTYHGLNSLHYLGVRPAFPQSTAQLVKRFQNGNGGFRRSIFMGLSTFESTFHALSCLQLLSENDRWVD
ncbi:MAG TPA: prenyltransferase/squalene oxidase repeat-containing protein [Candidatus Acidoferrales bacterium]|nr:prenyltransferase/squalene oxidase repeat-containing protein [Candidatus Acidoferrales bacterium]